jgi:hypothetical protein
MRFTSIFILFILISCTSENQTESEISRGFYHWKSKFELSNEQLVFLRNIDAEVLYLKYFDVVSRNNDYRPEAELDYITDLSDIPVPIVPTVYITTEVFYQIELVDIPKMAERVAANIGYVHPYGKEILEIQFDCDWTAEIKDKYFYFLEEFRNYYPEVILSATIRLYQYKYPELAGVPPIDKGMLMYYNMGDLTDYTETNSILNNEIGEQYLGFSEYPLPLDVALPNFKWSLLFREGEFQQICPDFTKKDLKNTALFASKRENWYVFKKDTVINNTYFRFGDELRYEYCSEEDLFVAANLLKKELLNENTKVIIYDLQTYTPNDYEKLDAVFSTFN